jgi:hypothetical protein
MVLPFADDTEWMLRHCKLPLHAGVGKVDKHGRAEHDITRMIHQARQAIGQTDSEQSQGIFDASFFVPPSGNCLAFLRWQGAGRLSRNFGKGLSVVGNGAEGPFRLVCPQYYVQGTSAIREHPGWAVASPVNEPAILSYGEDRPIAAVTAIMNNFDFDHGNQPGCDGEAGKVLRVEAAGRTVDFAWRRERVHLRQLVDAGLMGTTSFATFSFRAWPVASDEELALFARNVSSLCSYVAGQHTGIPVLSLLDGEGRVVRRLLNEVVESRFRNGHALRVIHAESGLPSFFRQCFDEHCRMQQTELWQRLPALFAAIEDPPYLEQMYATMMMAVELFIRGCLIEGGHLGQDEAETKTLPDLVGLARGRLRWDVPRHYTRGERYRTTRNAVDHGGALPDNADQVRAEFDKWKLFLLRRLFIRLGFNGEVASPQRGWASSSQVDEFSEEHNSFPA